MNGVSFTLVWFVVFLGSAIAHGDTFNILDATDFGGSFGVVSTSPARMVTNYNAPLAGLGVTLLAPSPNAVFVSDDCPLGQIACLHLNIGEYPINLNPALDFESDIFSGLSLDGRTYQLDLIAQTNFPCFAESGCLVRKDGLLYTLDTITWSDGTVDKITFQSTPEPSSLLLAGTVLLGLIRTLKRKLLS